MISRIPRSKAFFWVFSTASLAFTVWGEPVGHGNFSRVIRSNLSGHFELTEDVYLNETEPSWTPIGSQAQPFNGTLDGRYHVIYGLNVTTHEANTPLGLFGFIQDARVQRLVLYRPHVLSTGYNNPAGAVVGEMNRSQLAYCVNERGRVKIEDDCELYLCSSSAGGLAGLAREGSRIENSMNTAQVSASGYLVSHAGGLAGRIENSVVANNLNVGMVSTDSEWGHAGGLVGRVDKSSSVESNVNIGIIHSNKRSARAGGVAGHILATYIAEKSFLTNNLNIGSIDTNGYNADAGGIAGSSFAGNTIESNLNAGRVITRGHNADAGGLLGAGFSDRVANNLNAGDVSTNGTHSRAGGGVGSADYHVTVENNLNAGNISANGNNSYVGGGAGVLYFSTAKNNLNTGFLNASSTEWIQTEGTLDDSLDSIRAGHHKLDTCLWRNGETTQYPILKSVNAPYRELLRLNGTGYGIKDGNNTYTFPETLNDFADPGGPMDASLFDRMVWNIRKGYLPFLRGIGLEQAEKLGIDCNPGGFACEGEVEPSSTDDQALLAPTSSIEAQACHSEIQTGSVNSDSPVTKTPISSPDLLALSSSIEPVLSSSGNSVTEASISSLERLVSSSANPAATTPTPSPLTENCPMPVAVPYLQMFDSNSNRIYVVAYQPQTSQSLLIRYTADILLDEAFGSCGVHRYSGLPSSFTLTTVYEENNQRLIYLSTLVNGNITPIRPDVDQPLSQDIHIASDSEAQIHKVIFHNHELYFTGESEGHLLLGKSASLTDFRKEGQPGRTEAGYDLAVDKEGAYLYVTGRQDNNMLIRKYTLENLEPVPDFGSSGLVTDTFTNTSRGQALVLQNQGLYVAGNIESGEKDLFIRRYDQDGQYDHTFAEVNLDTGISELDAGVRLAASSRVLSVFKSNGSQVQVRVFDWQGQEVGQAQSLSGDRIAVHGLAINRETGQVYFATGSSDGTLSLKSLVIPQLAMNESTCPTCASTPWWEKGGKWEFPDWIEPYLTYTLIATAVVVTVCIVVTVTGGLIAIYSPKAKAFNVVHSWSNENPMYLSPEGLDPVNP